MPRIVLIEASMLVTRSTSSALVCLFPGICSISLIFRIGFRILLFSLYPIFSDSGLSGLLLTDQIFISIAAMVATIVVMAITAPQYSCRNLIMLIVLSCF